MVKIIIDPSCLATWDALNLMMRSTNDEKILLELLKSEIAHPKPRGVFVLRIHSRYARVRAERESVDVHKGLVPRSNRALMALPDLRVDASPLPEFEVEFSLGGIGTFITTINETSNEDVCRQLLAAEYKGQKRRKLIGAAFSKLNRLRVIRERVELMGYVKNPPLKNGKRLTA